MIGLGVRIYGFLLFEAIALLLLLLLLLAAGCMDNQQATKMSRLSLNYLVEEIPVFELTFRSLRGYADLRSELQPGVLLQMVSPPPSQPNRSNPTPSELTPKTGDITAGVLLVVSM
jgi:hypothetical protein